MKFPARLSKEGVMIPVMVMHAKGQVRVSDEDGASLTFAESELSFGVFAPGQTTVTVGFRARPDLLLYIDDPEQAELLRLLCVKRADVHGKTGGAFAALALMLAALFFLGLGFLVRHADFAAKAVVSVVPRTWEQPLAELALQRLQQHGVCADAAGLSAFASLATPLVRVAEITGYPPVKIIPVPSREVAKYMPPVLALPGAVIVISGAMIEAAQSPEELAAQTARALTQVRARWPLQNLLTRLGAAGLSVAMMPFLAATQPAVLAAGKMISFGYAYQGQETVDMEAARLLSRAGIGTEGLARLILREGGEGGGGAPVPEAVRLARHVREIGAGTPSSGRGALVGPVAWAALKGVCQVVRVPPKKEGGR